MNRIIFAIITILGLLNPQIVFSQQEIYDECQDLLLQGKIEESMDKAQSMYHPEASFEDNRWYYLHMEAYYSLISDFSKSEEILELMRPCVEESNKVERNFKIYFYFSSISFYSTYKTQRDTSSAYRIIEDCTRIEELLKDEIDDLTLSMLLTYKGQGYYQLQNYKEAKPILHKAIETISSSPQFQVYLFVSCCQNLSDVYQIEGDINKSILVLEDCINRASTEEKTDKILLSDVCRDLASLYESIADFDNYVKYQKKSSSFVEQYSLYHNREMRYDFDALGSAIHAAINYHQAGDYDRCLGEVLYILDAYSDEIVKDPSHASRCYMMLGDSYQQLGDLDNAERAYDIAVKQFGAMSEHNEYWYNSIRRIGEYYQALNNHVVAQSYFEVIKKELEQELKFGAPYAQCLCDLAYSKIALGQDLIAKIYIDTAYRMLIESDADPEWIVSALLTTVNFYDLAGYGESAIKTAQEAVLFANNHCREKTQQHALQYLATAQMKNDHKSESFETIKKLKGEYYSHPDVLAIRYKNGDLSVAKDAIANSVDIIDDVSKVFSFLSYDERENYWNNYSHNLTFYNTYIYNSKDLSSYGQVYNNAIFAKGLLLRSTTQLRDLIYTSSDSTAISLYNEMVDMQRALNESKFPSDSSSVVKSTISKYEKELRRRISSYDKAKSSDSYDWTSIRESLKKNEAAIEFIRLVDFVNDYTVYGSYAAVIIKKSSENPEIIELCKDNSLESCDKDDNDSLYTLLWKPIEPYLTGIKTVYYSPIGKLNDICFSALHSEFGYLCDRYSLNQVTSTQNVCSNKKITKQELSDIYLYGGISFDTDSTSMLTNASRYSNSGSTEYYAMNRSEDTLRAGFDDLPHTLYEVEEIEGILRKSGFSPTVLTADSANEESFKSFNHHAPSLIHFATHGFSVSKRTLNNVYIQSLTSQAANSSSLMTHSGLVLSGGNNAWINNIKYEGCEDGLLTSQEISNVDLGNTKIAILSACETGTGHITGEGVYGLQRAFKLAGVNTLIVTLRPVIDKVTKLLMVKFYTYWTNGAEVHSAFHQAISDIRKDYPDPKYWSSFIILD